MDLPTRFGQYELIRHLATGGMAEVFLARSFGVEGFQKHLVIKRILPGLARSPRFVSMFVREAKITAGLAHPNIVQVYELGRVGDDHYIAMEYIPGRDLTRVNRVLRAEGRRMPIPLAVWVVANVLRGLGHAHSLADSVGRPIHLVHRDVSPHNIAVSAQGEVKLFDFGIARLAGEARDAEGRPGGGKFAYMSPEQAAGQPLDGRSDLFSAGVVLYELLVGHRLFQHPDPSEKLRRVREALVPDPREECPDVPDDLWAILRRVLARDPADRPARAEQVEEDLLAFLFSNGLRADMGTMRGFMLELFGEALDDPGVVVDLQGLARDIGNLEERRRRERTGSGGSRTGSGPRRVRPPAGERKGVVVLVAEVVGFTALSERRDPEHVVRHHYRFLRRVHQVVERCGGHLQSFQDDALVVFFGIPRSGEHDLERALGCAEGLVRLGAEMGRRGLHLDVSVGVHRGEIHVGAGEGRSLRYLACGDTLKLARRLCAEADLGQVLVSEPVATLAGERFGFASGPEVRFKGHGVRQSFVLDSRKRRAAPATGRWLRRDHELDAMLAALGHLARGRGGVLFISGEAGMGKSRLVRELVTTCRSRGVSVFSGRAMPYGADRTLAPFRELVASVVGVDPLDPPDAVREALLRLAWLHLDEQKRAVLGSLFTLELGARGDELAVDALFPAVLAVVRALSLDRPAILALEDVQHLDGLEMRLLDYLVERSRDCPVVWILSSREDPPRQAGRPDWVVCLGRLGPVAQEELLREIVGIGRLDPRLVALVERTAEGNPLYMHEVVGALKRADRLRIADGRAELVDPDRDPNLPPGLQGLIAARIDDLDRSAKGVLQVAAVIGLGFSRDLVRLATGSESVGDDLDDLVTRGLVQRDLTGGEGRYAFSSTLVWEVVLRGIVGLRRRDLHRMVAAGIERLFEGRLDPHRQVLARHLAAGGRFLDAAYHAGLAGDLLRNQQLFEQAAGCWDLAVAWVEDARTVGEAAGICTQVEAELRLKSGSAWAMAGEPRRAEMHLLVALDLAGEVADEALEAHVQLELGRLFASLDRKPLAVVHLDAALTAARAEAAADPDLTPVDPVVVGRNHPRSAWRRRVAVEALEALGLIAHRSGETDDAVRLFEEAMRLAGDDDSLAARASLGLANRHIREGNELLALSLLDLALARAEASGDRLLVGRVLNNIGIVHHGAGRYSQALERFRASLEVRQGLGYRRGMVTNLHNIGDTHMRMGDAGRAWASFVQSNALADEIGWEGGRLMNEPFLAWLEALRSLGGESGETEEFGAGLSPEIFVKRLESAVSGAEAHDDKETAVAARRLLGLLLGRLGRREAAEAVLAEAHDAARRLGARLLVRDVARAREEVERGG